MTVWLYTTMSWKFLPPEVMAESASDLGIESGLDTWLYPGDATDVPGKKAEWTTNAYIL